MQDTRGYNPYKLGFVAGSDSHNTAVPYRQNNFFGQAAIADGTPQKRLSGVLTAGMDPRVIGTGGLAGVWAEENTRASIFEAMQRKETFATSGTHIKVRLFGGWSYTSVCWPTETGSGMAMRKGCLWGAICRRPRQRRRPFWSGL